MNVFQSWFTINCILRIQVDVVWIWKAFKLNYVSDACCFSEAKNIFCDMYFHPPYDIAFGSQVSEKVNGNRSVVFALNEIVWIANYTNLREANSNQL